MLLYSFITKLLSTDSDWSNLKTEDTHTYNIVSLHKQVTGVILTVSTESISQVKAILRENYSEREIKKERERERVREEEVNVQTNKNKTSSNCEQELNLTLNHVHFYLTYWFYFEGVS